MELSKLIWPTGLGRFATALFVASNSQYSAILAKVDQSSNRRPESLVVGQKQGSNGKENIVDVKMHLLNAVRVTGSPSGDGSLWLLPLVDDRYYRLLGSDEYWTLKGERTWDSWFFAAFGGLGYPSFRSEMFSDDYSGPGNIYWPEDNTPLLPPLVDSAAYCVNRRVVKQFDGEIDLMDIDNAENLWKVREGQAVVAGSRGKSTRLVIPATVSFKWHEGETIDVDVEALRDWGPDVRLSGVQSYFMRCSIPQGKDAEAGTFCEAFTEDNMRWRFIRQTIAFPGICKMQLTGAEDRVEFTVNASTAITNVYADQNDMVDSMSVSLDTTADPSCESCGGGGGGPENCPRVSLVGCTAGIMMVGYQLNCESVSEPVQAAPSGGPVGTIAMWGVATLPNGWLECNGSEFDPLVFPELFDVLGGRYVPDLRNQFVRGKGDKTGALLSKKQWTTGMPRVPFVAAAGGGSTDTTPRLASGSNATGYTEMTKHTHVITGGDTETAPDHIVLLYMIKAKI
jgi:microcystin-dependent protein